MNTPVSFKIAKLLKEKGFDKYGYLQDVWLGNKYEWKGKGKNKKSVEIPVFGLGSSSVLPTIADVVMWLYEKHGIWISVDMILSDKWFYNIKKLEPLGFTNLHGSHLLGAQPKSPTEAYEAAIEHILNNNLI